MINNFPSPDWHPTIVSSTKWLAEHLKAYLKNKNFAVFKNGSCVVWERTEVLSNEDCCARLLSAVTQYPDFKVRRHSSGDFLVTFKGGVGGLMSGKLLEENYKTLREEALSLGRLKSEKFHVEESGSFEEIELIAGLYVRAQLYRDAAHPEIIAKM